jgi:hypothetical protein
MSLMLEFEIVQVLSVKDDYQYIFARQIELGHDFTVKAGTYLGNVELDEYIDMPRALDENGQQRHDLFIFKPKHHIDKSQLSNGMIVRLSVPE